MSSRDLVKWELGELKTLAAFIVDIVKEISARADSPSLRVLCKGGVGDDHDVAELCSFLDGCPRVVPCEQKVGAAVLAK